MIPAALLLALAVGAVFSAAVLVIAAAKRPLVGALVERAAVAVLIALFALVYAVVALDTEQGRVLFSTDEARTLLRAAATLLFALPTIWTLLYLTGNLGDDGKGGSS